MCAKMIDLIFRIFQVNICFLNGEDRFYVKLYFSLEDTAQKLIFSNMDSTSINEI